MGQLPLKIGWKTKHECSSPQECVHQRRVSWVLALGAVVTLSLHSSVVHSGGGVSREAPSCCLMNHVAQTF